ncbi:MLL1 [Mytilus edulis]|uniref:MLL1 n=1 Tax=Mytilus edulis TaxID=6550 RepID=A0A8S3SUP6_MYTED|nr:MLL1 [Mytilus edulis]
MALYPCVQCDEECVDCTIQCSCCDRWVHSACVPMDDALLLAWSDVSLKFLCKDCCFTDNKYDMAKALERGQYRVADSHKHFEITATSWVNKTVQERERLTKRFKSYIPPDKRVITSTDGRMNVIKPRALGKKIGQRKRKINERTTTFKKKKD